MAPHRTADLELRKDKPDNVYRYLEEWELVPSSHSADGSISYLLLYGVFQWGSDRALPVKGFSIAVQYGREPGRQVDVSQPPHILVKDSVNLVESLRHFVQRLSSGTSSSTEAPK